MEGCLEGHWAPEPGVLECSQVEQNLSQTDLAGRSKPSQTGLVPGRTN